MSGLRVLVVDDLPQNVELLRQWLEQTGNTAITAMSGEEALAAFERERPDLVLMDVMLPGMSGIETTARIRAVDPDDWVPIIYLSALSHREDVMRGLDAGGDDYLTKPVDLALLATKMRAMRRIAQVQARLAATSAELERHRQAAEQEQETARELMELMIRHANIDEPGLHMWLEPATRFSGDLLIASRSRFGHLYLLHADAMGHGLTAALPLLPIAQIFRTMTERGITLPVIVSEMNASLRKQIPRGFFVSATLACIDRRNRTVEVWNGGNPDGLLVTPEGDIVRRFSSRHLALGILDADGFDASTEVWQTRDRPTRLILYSDGLTEAQDAAGNAFGEERLLAALRHGGFDALVGAVRRHLDGARAHDDISLISVECAEVGGPAP